jgi:hypothetical protein
MYVATAQRGIRLCGYIEDIDSFDHAFFGFAKGEADNMAPQHRLAAVDRLPGRRECRLRPGSSAGNAWLGLPR